MAEFAPPLASRGAPRGRVPSSTPIAEADINPAIARDPGVQASPQAFGANVGASVAGLGDVGTKVAAGAGESMAAVQARRQSYKDTIERVRLETLFDKESMEDVQTAASAADMTQETTLAGLGERLAERRQKTLDTLRATGASEEAVALAESRLLRREGQFIGNISAQSHELARKRVGDVVGSRFNEINADVAANPDLLDRGFLGVDHELADNGTPIPPVERQILGTAAKNNLVKTAVTTLIRRNKIDEAKAMLLRTDVASVLGANTRASIDTMIDAYETARDKATQEGAFLRDRFRAALGPKATEAQVDEAVKRELKINPTRLLTPEETVSVGLPKGTIIQQKSDGTLDVLYKPPEPGAQVLSEDEAKAAGFPAGYLVQRKKDGNFDIIGKTPETEVELTKAKKKAELEAVREGITDIIRAAGAPASPAAAPGSPGVAVTPEEIPAGPEGDAQRVTQLFRASQRLTLAGQSTLANSLLAQARFIAENSPEILKSKKMNEPISADLASELGVPVGTTMAEVVGVTMRSPEQIAAAKTEATTRAKQKVQGEEQLSFIGDARTVISDLMTEIQRDPGVVGIKGTLRSTGKTAVGVLSDLGLTGLVDRARDLAATQTDASVDEVKGWFDSPTLSVLSLIENSVGLMLARLRQPDGRVSVDVIKRSIADMKLSGLTSSQNVVDRLTFIQRLLDSREKSVRKQSGLSDSGSVPRFRVVDGKLEQVK